MAVDYQALSASLLAGKLIWADWGIIGIVGLSSVFGLFRGFIKEVFALVLWMLAIAVGLQFSREVAAFLPASLTYPSVRISAAFGLLFITTLTIGSFISFLLGYLIASTGLTGTDRLLGMGFGLVRGSVVVALIVMLAGLTPLPEDPWWKQSVLIPPFQALAVWLKAHAPSTLSSYLNYR